MEEIAEKQNKNTEKLKAVYYKVIMVLPSGSFSISN